MCIGRPKMPSPQIINQPAPMAPPPPTPLAEEVEDKRKNKKDSRRRGTSSLTIRRPSVNLPSGGSGANVNY
tara:strand:- start:399 stop:611 length:213 start_codon:yes stop_codon:yes gene_type:complete